VAAWEGALGGGTIGERIGKPIDRTQQLAGDVWFYYGARYGEYLGTTHQGEPEDYLPAELEASPGRAAGYAALGDHYADNGHDAEALAEYQLALELSNAQPSVHDRIATILWKQGDHAGALAHWKAALDALSSEQNRHILETFWSDFDDVVQHAGARGLLPQLRPQIDSLLRTYLRRNGSYRSTELLRSVFRATNDAAGGVARMLGLVPFAADQEQLLRELSSADWIPQPERAPFYQALLAKAEAAASKSEGENRQNALDELHRRQLEWIGFLLDTRQAAQARSAVESLGWSEETRTAMITQIVPLEVRLAALSGSVSELLQRYRSGSGGPPPLNLLRKAALALQQSGDLANSRSILEFVYTQQIENHELTSANLLGLAEIRLQQNDLAAALALLRRLTLAVGEPFENLVPAGDLLLRYQHPAEAAAFLEQRVKAVPWDAAARVKYLSAGAKPAPEAASQLVGVVGSSEVPYSARLDAAGVAARLKIAVANPGSQELQLLAAGTVSAQQAGQPYFYVARVRAAETAPNAAARLKLLREAIAVNPNEQTLRLSVFRAAIADGQYRFAISSIEDMINRSYGSGGDSMGDGSGGDGSDDPADIATDQDNLDSVLPDSAFGPNDSNDEDQQEGDEGDYVSQQTSILPQFHLTKAQQARVAAQLALAYEKVDELTTARSYYRLAANLEPDHARRATLQAAAASTDAKLALRKQNALRRPQIHKELEQERIVKPRLVAQSSTQTPDRTSSASPAATPAGRPR
jgi:predicted negative regulator of RcsB-dependent stress response